MTESNTKTAIITAVVTGVFTVLAGLATYWLTTKEPELSFSLVGGPTLSGTTGAKRIFVVEVRNSGRKEITQTLVQLAIKSGELSEVAAEASQGVKLAEEKSPRQVEIRADLLNPGDVVKVSFLISLASPDVEPTVVVRAPGVIAVAEHTKRKGFSSLFDTSGLLVLVTTTSAAFLSSFLLISRPWLARKLGLKSFGPPMDQSEVTAFVCGVCGLYEEANHLRFGGGDISYRGAVDYLGHRAKSANAADLPKFETAVRALLLNDAISEISLKAIRIAINVMGPGKMSDSEFSNLRAQAIHEGADPVAWREKVEAYVNARLAAG